MTRCPHLCLSLFPALAALALGVPAAASADTDVGGVDLDGYCTSKGFDGVELTGPVTGPYSAYNWHCKKGSETYSIDMQDVCRTQYQNPAAIGEAQTLDDAYSWRCIVHSELVRDKACLPEPVIAHALNDPTPEAGLAELGTSDYGAGGGTSTDPPPDLGSPADLEADPCAWRGTFKDGYTLAGDRAMVDLGRVSRKRRNAKVRFVLKEEVPWKVCAAGRKWERCAEGDASLGSRKVTLRGPRGKKVPKLVQLQFTDRSSTALQSYDLRFQGTNGVITRAPESLPLATPPIPTAMRANGYPDGVGDWLHGNTFSNWISNVLGGAWWVGLPWSTCVDFSEKYWFVEYYKREQQHIRANFDPAYNLGRPVTALRVDVRGFAWRNWRFYQVFDGGTWGRSSLTAPRSQLFADRCSQKPHLVTGAIFRKWEQIGHVNTMGGPQGGQYREGPFIKQNFENGQIGFRDGNTGTVWYRFGNGAWRS